MTSTNKVLKFFVNKPNMSLLQYKPNMSLMECKSTSNGISVKKRKKEESFLLHQRCCSCDSHRWCHGTMVPFSCCLLFFERWSSFIFIIIIVIIIIIIMMINGCWWWWLMMLMMMVGGWWERWWRSFGLRLEWPCWGWTASHLLQNQFPCRILLCHSVQNFRAINNSQSIRFFQIIPIRALNGKFWKILDSWMEYLVLLNIPVLFSN